MDQKIDFDELSIHSARLPNYLRRLMTRFPRPYYLKCHVLGLSASLKSFVIFRCALVLTDNASRGCGYPDR